MSKSDVKRLFLQVAEGYIKDDYDLRDVCREADSLEWLYYQLADCRDPMPSDACEDLGLPEGSTYADGVRCQRDLEHRLFEDQHELADPFFDAYESDALYVESYSRNGENEELHFTFPD